MMGPCGWGFDMMGGWLGGFLMLLFGALIVMGVVLLIVWVVRQSTGHAGFGGPPQQPSPQAGPDEAVAIARKRLAAGEITTEQYEELMRVLGR